MEPHKATTVHIVAIAPPPTCDLFVEPPSWILASFQHEHREGVSKVIQWTLNQFCTPKCRIIHTPCQI